MKQNQSHKSLANVCLFCGDSLSSPSMCTYCGFKFCPEHKSTENHQCIKTRYSEYVRKTNPNKPVNISRGDFRVVCEMCGFTTSKAVPIEYAGEELVQHMQIVGCSEKVFLEEVTGENPNVSTNLVPDSNKQEIKPTDQTEPKSSETSTSIVDQILKLSALKEKGMISDEEFSYIKQELIKKLR